MYLIFCIIVQALRNNECINGCECTRAVASGVKGGDDFRGPRLRGTPPPPGRSQRTGWGQLKKRLRTVDRPLLRIVTKAYHLHVFLSLANLKIQKNLKHSNARSRKAELSTCAQCSMRMQRAASHGQQDQTELSFVSSCTWTSKQKKMWKSPIQHQRCSVLFCSVRTGRTQRDASQSAWTPKFDLSCSCTDKCMQNDGVIGEYPRKNCQLCLKWK